MSQSSVQGSLKKWVQEKQQYAELKRINPVYASDFEYLRYISLYDWHELAMQKIKELEKIKRNWKTEIPEDYADIFIDGEISVWREFAEATKVKE